MNWRRRRPEQPSDVGPLLDRIDEAGEEQRRAALSLWMALDEVRHAIRQIESKGEHGRNGTS